MSDADRPAGGNFDIAGTKVFIREWHQLWVDLARAPKKPRPKRPKTY